MADIKKFLDQAGVSTLWNRITTELENKAYNDSELRNLIKTNTDAITILNGDSAVEGSVSKKVAEGIATVIACADASFDTLKEIADWIVNDTTGAASMANKISALETLVGNITVATQIANAIEAALKIDGVDKYALANDLTALARRVTTLEGASHTHDNKDLLDTYTQTEVDLADAVTKKHDHANKAILDTITDGKIAAWDAAESNANSYTNAEIAKIQALTESQIHPVIATAISAI